MAISEQFKSLNLNQKKNDKVMHWWSRSDQNEEKCKKTLFATQKKLIFFTALFWLLLWLCISKMFVKLEKALLYHFKSLKMEKNWERSTKVFSDRLMFGDKHIYTTIDFFEPLEYIYSSGRFLEWGIDTYWLSTWLIYPFICWF
jgi:hypothetical protein